MVNAYLASVDKIQLRNEYGEKHLEIFVTSLREGCHWRGRTYPSGVSDFISRFLSEQHIASA